MGNIKLRYITPDDAEELVNIYSYYVTDTAITYEYTVPSVDEFRARIVNTLKGYPYIAAERDGQIIGYAYLSAFHPRKAYEHSAETSIYLKKHERGNGLGSLLYKKLEEIAVRMGITNLYACIAYPDSDDEYLTNNSADYHEHIGYRRVGNFVHCAYKFGHWYNMVWYEKFISEHSTKPGELKSFNDIRNEITL